MTDVEKTVNIGAELGKRLRAVGVATQEELLRLGDDAAFAKLTARFAEHAHPAGACRRGVRGAVVRARQGLRAELTRGLSR